MGWGRTKPNVPIVGKRMGEARVAGVIEIGRYAESGGRGAEGSCELSNCDRMGAAGVL